MFSYCSLIKEDVLIKFCYKVEFVSRWSLLSYDPNSSNSLKSSEAILGATGILPGTTGFFSTESRSYSRSYRVANSVITKFLHARSAAVPQGNPGAAEFQVGSTDIQSAHRSGFREFVPDFAPDFFPFFGEIVFNLDSKSSPSIYTPCMPA